MQLCADRRQRRVDVVDLDPKVLQAMMKVPRHEFIPSSFGHRAYDDEPVPLPCLQTVSQPYMVAAMAAALKLTGNETVLEIGAGSGYAAAVLSELSRHVYTIERQHELVEHLLLALLGDGQVPYVAYPLQAGLLP